MYCFQIYKYITLCIVLNKQRHIALIVNIYCDTKSTVVVFEVHCGVRDWTWPSCYFMYVHYLVWYGSKTTCVLMLWRCLFVYQVLIFCIELFYCVPLMASVVLRHQHIFILILLSTPLKKKGGGGNYRWRPQSVDVNIFWQKDEKVTSC